MACMCVCFLNTCMYVDAFPGGVLPAPSLAVQTPSFSVPNPKNTVSFLTLSYSNASVAPSMP